MYISIHVKCTYLHTLYAQINVLYVRVPVLQPSVARPDLVARTTGDAGEVEVEVDVAVALEVSLLTVRLQDSSGQSESKWCLFEISVRSFSGGGGSWGFARDLQRHVGFQTFFHLDFGDLFSLGSQGNRGRSRNPGTNLERTCQGIQLQASMAIFCRQPS